MVLFLFLIKKKKKKISPKYNFLMALSALLLSFANCIVITFIIVYICRDFVTIVVPMSQCHIVFHRASRCFQSFILAVFNKLCFVPYTFHKLFLESTTENKFETYREIKLFLHLEQYSPWWLIKHAHFTDKFSFNWKNEVFARNLSGLS